MRRGLRRVVEAEGSDMLRLLKVLLVLVVLAGIAVVGYAYFGDLDPDRTEVRQPVTLDGDD